MQNKEHFPWAFTGSPPKIQDAGTQSWAHAAPMPLCQCSHATPGTKEAVSFKYAVPFKGYKAVLEMDSSSVSNLYLLKKIERLFMQKDKIPPYIQGTVDKFSHMLFFR